MHGLAPGPAVAAVPWRGCRRDFLCQHACRGGAFAAQRMGDAGQAVARLGHEQGQNLPLQAPVVAEHGIQAGQRERRRIRHLGLGLWRCRVGHLGRLLGLAPAEAVPEQGGQQQQQACQDQCGAHQREVCAAKEGVDGEEGVDDSSPVRTMQVIVRDGGDTVFGVDGFFIPRYKFVLFEKFVIYFI
ncbi:hypothetical protein CSZ94_04960 [Janthinobacterium sp. ROICE36]|nr:hypothetical protein CSZ94_04960 [Janthinobacterium sp. ROICE36]